MYNELRPHIQRLESALMNVFRDNWWSSSCLSAYWITWKDAAATMSALCTKCSLHTLQRVKMIPALQDSNNNIAHYLAPTSTYDHRVWKTGLPVRSAVLKPHAGWLVVGWVTTSESQLLYVFFDDLSFWDGFLMRCPTGWAIILFAWW